MSVIWRGPLLPRNPVRLNSPCNASQKLCWGFLQFAPKLANFFMNEQIQQCWWGLQIEVYFAIIFIIIIIMLVFTAMPQKHHSQI